jgi:exo-beta-1,3-glucanase (GH17 family)
MFRLFFGLVIATTLIALCATPPLKVQAGATADSQARTIIGPIRGVDYGPFHNGESPSGPCFTSNDIAQDLPLLSTMGNYIRVYSVAKTPCDYYDMILTFLAAGLRVVPSAYLCSTCDNATEVNNLIALLNSLAPGELDKIPFVVVGTEPISFKGMTVSQVETFIDQVRTQGPQGVKITTAEIYYQYLANGNVPCQRTGFTDLGNFVDVIYFDIYPGSETPPVPLAQAVGCILNVYGSLDSAYPLSKPIVIAETGWPSGTSPNDQQTFWQSFITAARQTNIEYFGFEAFDEMWKGGTEATFGLWNATRQPKAPCGFATFNPVAAHDFSGNGKSDIAWRSTSGDAAAWLMNGAQLCTSAGLGSASITWSIVGQRDFDGNGRADFLWHDITGNVAIWFMDGTQVSSSVGVGNVSTAWSIAGTGDFNGDGKGDILWHDTSGNVAIWLMNGAQVTQSAGVGNVPAVWSIAGTGDFNGDGESDILWHDSSGNVAIWFMNGARVSSSAGVGNVSTAWSIVGTGDFDGDGKSDILWRDSSGNVAVWLMNGAKLSQSAGLGSAPTIWSIVETGDFNGDDKSDILWHDTSGNVAIWLMNGTQVTQSAGVGNVPTMWSIQGTNAD